MYVYIYIYIYTHTQSIYTHTFNSEGLLRLFLSQSGSAGICLQRRSYRRIQNFKQRRPWELVLRNRVVTHVNTDWLNIDSEGNRHVCMGHDVYPENRDKKPHRVVEGWAVYLIELKNMCICLTECRDPNFVPCDGRDWEGPLALKYQGRWHRIDRGCFTWFIRFAAEKRLLSPPAKISQLTIARASTYYPHSRRYGVTITGLLVTVFPAGHHGSKRKCQTTERWRATSKWQALRDM
jgi:hypothetical protein